MPSLRALNPGFTPLLLVCGAHALALGGLAMGMGRPMPIKPPEVITAVVLPQPMPVVAPPSEPTPQPPKPQPVVRPKPTPTPLPPIKQAPPAPNAITAPPVEPTPPVEVAKAEPAAAPEPAPAPIVPPLSNASYLNNQAPGYPAMSRKLGEAGRVVLSVYVLADGSVGDIKLKRSSGHDRLDDAALAAVKRWRFVPAKQGDAAIPYRYDLPINFSLDA
ncbi:energy transducer TonB [Chitinimonas viridis]|uniref:Protein TonB n=2 Tax=Chitinimonas TaxID=240411 RepID=A0ABT8B2E9_9NEIS|nr:MULTISPECIES: energy transducer TonB [Chitinimonas]MDN3576291.1 energy transducer TonB [Chitinimonas viridis]GLR15074.1 hypothetical protein GCM10007907_38640 [Chitinimonas prasina]